MRHLPRSVLVFAVLGALAACQGHPGRVLVVVDSDYSVPAELAEVRILAGPVDDPESRMGQDFVLTAFRPAPAGLENLPLSLVVVPRGGDSSRRVDIIVEGRSAASGDVLIRTTRVLDGFRAGDTVVLPIFLTRNCEGQVCGAGRTCINGACESSTIDPGVLRIAQDPGEELRGLPDAAVSSDSGADSGDGGGSGDAAVDSGAIDASIDAAVDAAGDSAAEVGPADSSVADAGPCGASVTLPYSVIMGGDQLFPLTPGPGTWAYNDRLADFDTYVEWAHTAPPGCEIWRIEPILPDGVPADPFVDCTGRCAEGRTVDAIYEVYLDGAAIADQLESHNQASSIGRTRVELNNPARTVSLRLSDWSPRVPVDREFIVFHDAEIFMRPAP